mmetsp:Transcript_14451/g.31305  ORF Transcript_14451/g.31305 Transcript_14451/m.31305 type:complete len:413 (+) Transcript_14451:87-1325(+)
MPLSDLAPFLARSDKSLCPMVMRAPRVLSRNLSTRSTVLRKQVGPSGLPPQQQISSFVCSNVSGPQGNVRPFTIINDVSAWKAWDVAESDVTLDLTSSDIASIESALEKLQASGRPLSALTQPGDFPLASSLATKLQACMGSLLHGRGVMLVRGMAHAAWNQWQREAAYKGLAVHLGCHTPYAAPEHGLVSTTCLSTSVSTIQGVLYSQPCSSSVTSLLAVHNEMLTQGQRDVVACLAGMPCMVQSTAGEYELTHPNWLIESPSVSCTSATVCYSPVCQTPVFSYGEGRLGVQYHPEKYLAPMSSIQTQALEIFKETASNPSLQLQLSMQPGDVLFYNTSAVLVSHSAMETMQLSTHDTPAARSACMDTLEELEGGWDSVVQLRSISMEAVLPWRSEPCRVHKPHTCKDPNL